MTRHRPLRELADIFPGTSVPGKIAHNPHGRFHLILPRHVDEDGSAVHYDQIKPAERVNMDVKVSADRLLRIGDVLFMSRGERNRAAVIIGLPAEPTITSSVFYVLRPLPSVKPTFLAWALNQRPMQDAIRQIRTASVATPLVPRDAFSSLPLPLPDLERQGRIAALGDLLLQEQRLQNRLASAVTERNRLIGAQLLTSSQ